MDVFSKAPLAYVGEDEHNHTCLSVAQLVNQIENKGFEVDHTHVNQNMLLNVMGILLHDAMILLWEMACMVGNPLLVHLAGGISLA